MNTVLADSMLMQFSFHSVGIPTVFRWIRCLMSLGPVDLQARNLKKHRIISGKN